MDSALIKANIFVSGKETEYINELILQHDKMAGKHPQKAERVLGEIISESQRLNPAGKWDEEEVIISIIERKKK